MPKSKLDLLPLLPQPGGRRARATIPLAVARHPDDLVDPSMVRYTAIFLAVVAKQTSLWPRSMTIRATGTSYATLSRDQARGNLLQRHAICRKTEFLRRLSE